MTAAFDELRRDAQRWSWRGGLSITGMLGFCGGIAVTIHDGLDPDPLLGWLVGAIVMAVGLAMVGAASALQRRHLFRLAERRGLTRADAEAIWSEDDEDDG